MGQGNGKTGPAEREGTEGRSGMKGKEEGRKEERRQRRRMVLSAQCRIVLSSFPGKVGKMPNTI